MSTKTIQSILTVMLSCFFSCIANAQLTADFSFDKPGGCAPLAVSFTNTTTGASPNASFSWEFGNGNSAILQNPAAVFEQPATYSVTLTVRDGGKTSTKTHTITVYKQPTVAFSSSVDKGCLPLPVEFTSTSTAGDGEIASLMWGFGDGSVQESGAQPITHTYTEPTKAGVSLTVTNTYGCQSTILQKEMVNILPELVAAFTPRDTFLCKITDAASFTNRSTGPGNLTYSWDFGDGETSSAREPSHVYKTKGSYIVTLKVSSSEGCNSQSVQQATLHIANFKSEIQVDEPLCMDGFFIKNSSTPVPLESTWIVNNYSTIKTGSDSFQIAFLTPGPQKIVLRNNFGACSQTIERTLDIKPLPNIDGFVAEPENDCGAAVKVNFKDTSVGAVKWLWTFTDYFHEPSTQKNPSFVYEVNRHHTARLTVTNSFGCKKTVYQYVVIKKPFVQINTDDATASCGDTTISFYVKSDIPVAKYLWDFGDGSSSTTAKPTHLFKVGGYRVKLNYELEGGCTGEVFFDNHITIRAKPKNDFTVSSNDVCGNTPVIFTNTSSYSQYTNYSWDFGDGTTGGSSNYVHQQGYHKYEKEGVFTITLYATDFICFDTVVKKNFIKISPPFPRIDSFSRTCSGTRGEVTFYQSSQQTELWKWDFRDGQTIQLPTNQKEIKHTYSKTGPYIVTLTNKNGNCVVKDSIIIAVLIKQQPKLSITRSQVCHTDELAEFLITNLDQNPYYTTYEMNYAPLDGHYRNGKHYELTQSSYDIPYVTSLPLRINIRNFEPGEEGFRIVLQSSQFLCADTTNFIPVKFRGPRANFIAKIDNPCRSGNLVNFKDSSFPTDKVPLRLWEYFHSYAPIHSSEKPEPFSYDFSPHPYVWVQLKLTDAEGCYGYADKVFETVGSSVSASFGYSATTISPGTTIEFYNSTNSTDPDNMSYQWLFGDGKKASTFDASNKYVNPGYYTVKLIAKNLKNNCLDTATVTINVKFVNAAFSINSNFIGDSKCPPVLVRFNNNSNNVAKISWDFGDGTQVDNVFHPSHIYTKAGKYYITLRTWSDNGTLYTTRDSVEIQSSTATLKASRQHSCASQQITLMADVKNVSSYLWDFGDGVVQQATDTFASHLYKTPGIYTPRLILTDPDGCSSSVQLKDPVVIDSLSVALNNVPTTVCSPKEMLFIPLVVSIAGNQSPQNLTYKWNFGTGIAGDTSNLTTPSFLFTKPGTYPVSVIVKSAYGCVKQASSKIEVFRGLGATINGPSEICAGTTATFSGSTQIPGQPKWKWLFEDGSTISQQITPPRLYNTAGTYTIRLIVDNEACSDTVSRTLIVYAKPVVTLSSRSEQVCEGSTVTLVAAGGTTYSWSPAPSSGNAGSASIQVSPANDLYYVVTVTNDGGCSNKDSVLVKVVHPFTLQMASEAFVCAGKTLTLNASGAASYQWISNVSSLSNTGISNPVASPTQSSIYTVVGTDQFKCFSDTASIAVRVATTPIIDAGPDTLLMGGSSYQMQPAYSNDVTEYRWQPDRFLNCSNCPRPVVTPAEAITYTLTATNSFGCTASDTINIKISCAESRIHIPNAFTPNHDGKNENFGIRGTGIREIKYLRIYNRFGQMIFEKRNFGLGDPAGDWDGTFKGKPVDPGAYIYMAEMTCNEKSFTKKGTVTIIF